MTERISQDDCAPNRVTSVTGQAPDNLGPHRQGKEERKENYRRPSWLEEYLHQNSQCLLRIRQRLFPESRPQIWLTRPVCPVLQYGSFPTTWNALCMCRSRFANHSDIEVPPSSYGRWPRPHRQLGGLVGLHAPQYAKNDEMKAFGRSNDLTIRREALGGRGGLCGWSVNGASQRARVEPSWTNQRGPLAARPPFPPAHPRPPFNNSPVVSSNPIACCCRTKRFPSPAPCAHHGGAGRTARKDSFIRRLIR